MNKTKRMAVLSLFTALTVILAKLVAINLPLIRIGMEFVSVSVASIIFGPSWGALSAVLADILGGVFFPTGPYSPVITVVSLSNGLIYGFFLHRHKITLKRTMFTVLVKAIISDFVLMTIALYTLYKTPLPELLLSRGIKTVAVMIVETMVIYFVLRPLTDNLTKRGWIGIESSK